jgi:predicted HTH transcriptional regulator
MGTNKPYMASGKDIWVKVSSDKRRAKREEIQRLLQSSGHLYADEMPVDNTNLSNLDLDLFKSFYENRTGEKLEDIDIHLKKVMSNLKLMANGKLTLAGLLVFGKKPEERKPQFIIKAVSFFGNSAAGGEYKDSRDISGNVPKIFEAGRAFLINNLRKIQKDQHFDTTGILEIPIIALEEALINSIVHRNYFLSSNIRIFIFDDRVEIISPGTLPNTVNVESMKMGIHIERNPILVSLLKDIKGIPYRGIGTGVQRIVRECKNAGVIVDFIDEKDAEQFKVVFFRSIE